MARRNDNLDNLIDLLNSASLVGERRLRLGGVCVLSRYPAWTLGIDLVFVMWSL
jgi:hypothetical protein